MNATASSRGAFDAPPHRRSTVLRWCASLTLDCTAAIHASAVGQLYGAGRLQGLLVVALALAEALLALAVVARATPAVYRAAIALSVATVAVWAVTRTVGVPAGPQPWGPRPIGAADAVAALLELATAMLLSPLLRPAGSRVSVAVVSVAAMAATAFAVAPAAAQRADGAAAHEHGVVPSAHVPPPGPTGEFSLADARRARRCAGRVAGAARVSATPRTHVTLTARDGCFDATVLSFAAGRRIVVHLDNRERVHTSARAHAFSIYAFSTIPARHHPVVIGDPVSAGRSLDVRFRAPPPGSYFFQCDIHRFMRGIAVFR